MKAVLASSRVNLHDYGDKDGRAQALEQDIGQWLEDGVGDEEERKGSIVLVGRQVMQARLETGDFGISNVGTIKESEKVQDTEL